MGIANFFGMMEIERKEKYRKEKYRRKRGTI
jgi:hypothetical protein